MADIVISGNTSGSVTLRAPDIAGSPILTLPTTTGTLVVTGGAQTIEFAAGSAASPSITFTGDTNTGIFSPTADTVGFTTGGSERMRIDSSGQVGVGVTPNTWSTGRVVEVGASGTSLWGLSSGTSYVTAGYYFNSTDKFALTGNYAIFSQLVPSDGSFRWRASTATGTAGNNATMETNLTLTQGGTLVLKNGNTAATGIGITFPATQSASSDANTLDDYEEGTWTPTLTGGTTNPTVTYTIQYGQYNKIGNLVVLRGRLQTSAISGGSGGAKIDGLPFSVGNNGIVNIGCSGISFYSNITLGAGYTQLGSYPNVTGANYVNLAASGTGVAATGLNVSNMGNALDISFMIIYIT